MQRYVVKRFGFRITRGWFALIIITAALLAASFWIGPFRPLPAQLQLLALSSDGRFQEVVAIPSAWADTLPAASEATARFPLVLAVHNAGVAPAQPTHLAINLPARYRVTNSEGQPLPFHTTMGNPLVRYELPVRLPKIEPNQMPTTFADMDTLWLEAIVPTIYCTALADSVPEFVSAPPQDARAFSNVRMFYSFSGPRIRQRQTGLLTVQVDPNLVKRDPAPNPPIFETEVIKPAAPLPRMDSAIYVGQRATWCGDPGRPMRIVDLMWKTPEGGRFFMVYNGKVPRKYLYDLNGDSIIELEMWDTDGDGKFESRRPARMYIPSFLMPYTAADTALAQLMDTTAATPEWFSTFYDTTAGVLRFDSATMAKRRATQPAAPGTPGAVTPNAAPSGAPAGAPSASPVQLPANLQVDSAWLRVFNNTSAGPLRFRDAAAGKPPAQPATPARRPPAPRRETGPKLLGVPVDSHRR